MPASTLHKVDLPAAEGPSPTKGPSKELAVLGLVSDQTASAGSVRQRCALTVLIPFFNEAGNIHPLLDECHAALAGVDYEIVCVNDASSAANTRSGFQSNGTHRANRKLPAPYSS